MVPTNLRLEFYTITARMCNTLAALPTIPTVNARDVYLSRASGRVVTWLLGDARLYAFKAACKSANRRTFDCETALTSKTKGISIEMNVKQVFVVADG
jgi:hypothetical protein